MIRVLSSHETNALMGKTADAGFGTLETERGCLPLESMAVVTRIDGLAVHTTVQQRFANTFKDPLEATYIFPLPPRSAVVGFTMKVNGREVAGVILERAKAREAYDDAIAEGRSAAITEEERPNIFTLRVGNIPEMSAVDVVFQLVEQVLVDAGEATYRFPLVVAPRYCPGEILDGEPVGDGTLADTTRVPDASRISPPVMLPGMSSPIALSITAVFAGREGDGGVANRTIACSLPVSETYGEDGSFLVDVLAEQDLDRDFILRWPVGAAAAATVSVALEPDAGRSKAGLGTGKIPQAFAGDGTFEVTIIPPTDMESAQASRDIVFLLDRSGSMSGWQMTAARRAVGRLVETLTADDRVEVIAFDTSFESVDEETELLAATNHRRTRLTDWLEAVEARGGTDLPGAVEHGLATLAAGGTPNDGRAREKTLVVLTDGLVGHENAVLQSLADRVDDVHVFAIGIATSVNESVLGRMAEASGGIAELVESEERLDEVMEKIRQRLGRAVVSQLTLEGQGLEIVEGSLAPSRLPDLYAGLPVIVRGRYRVLGENGNGGILVRGQDSAGREWTVSGQAHRTPVEGLSSLWARGMLRAFEDRFDSQRGSRDGSGLRESIVELSTACGVLCRFTAVVAIDPRDPTGRKNAAPSRKVVMPVFMESVVCGLDEHICYAVAPDHAFGALRSRRAGLRMDATARQGKKTPTRRISARSYAAEKLWQKLWQDSAALRAKHAAAMEGGPLSSAEELFCQAVEELHRVLRRQKGSKRYVLLRAIATQMQAVIEAPGEVNAIQSLREAVQQQREAIGQSTAGSIKALRKE